MLLIFRDLNKVQLHQLPYRDNPHHEIGIPMSFKYLNPFKPNEHREDYQKANAKIFLFEIEDEKYIYAGEILVGFETRDKIINYSSELGLNDIKLAFAYGKENLYFLLHRKYITIEEYKTSTEKDEYQYLYEEDGA